VGSNEGAAAILPLVILSFALAASCATVLGGMAALQFRDHHRLFLGFSAGAVIALAFFDLLPESLRLAGAAAPDVLACAGFGFFGYAVLDRLLPAHHDHGASGRRFAGAGTLCMHSVMDGLALGLAFQASPRIGIVVALAVLAHDGADGMNTVGLILRNAGGRRQAWQWLVIDAAAPLAGAAASLLLSPPREVLALALSAVGGFFLYIGACDLLPESVRDGPRLPVTAVTLLGAAFIFAVAHLAG
jgi:ZIP family zinc transporter